MSILDNLECDTVSEHTLDVRAETHLPFQCEHCHKADAAEGDDFCAPCRALLEAAESDPLAVTLVDIAQTRIDHAWMRDLLSVLSDEERDGIVAAGRI